VNTSVLVAATVTVPGDTVSTPVPSAHVTVTIGDGLSSVSDPPVMDCSKALKVAGPAEPCTVASL
jgi:hypothetical protein